MFGGSFVDMNMLEKGIYITDVPALFKAETTIDSLIEQAETVKKATGYPYFIDEYILNLRNCILKDVTLIVPTEETLPLF